MVGTSTELKFVDRDIGSLINYFEARNNKKRMHTIGATGKICTEKTNSFQKLLSVILCGIRIRIRQFLLRPKLLLPELEQLALRRGP